MFTGMNPLLVQDQIARALPFLANQGAGTDRAYLVKQMEELNETAGSKEEAMIIDSSFESGNLDMAIQVDKNEYDMYMRVDTNTRGHHQWFYFKVNNKEKVGKIKFNIVNFTKR